MPPPIRILWSDSAAGTAVGIATLAVNSWLAEFYRLPREVIRWIGCANLVYGAFAAIVALATVGALGTGSRARLTSSRRLVLTLIAANAGWACVCLALLVAYATEASLFGCAHVALEGLFVLGLAVLEYCRVLPVVAYHSESQGNVP